MNTFRKLGYFLGFEKKEKEFPDLPNSPRSKKKRSSSISSSISGLEAFKTDKAKIIFTNENLFTEKNFNLLSEDYRFTQHIVRGFLESKDKIKYKKPSEIKLKIRKEIIENIKAKVKGDGCIKDGMKFKEMENIFSQFDIEEMTNEIYSRIERAFAVNEVNSKKEKVRNLINKIYSIYSIYEIYFDFSDEESKDKINYIISVKEIIFKCIEKGDSSVLIPDNEEHKEILEFLYNGLLDEKILDNVKITQAQANLPEALETPETIAEKELNMSLNDLIKRSQALKDSLD